MPRFKADNSQPPCAPTEFRRLLDPATTPTMPIPDAGRFLGLDRSASYRAAKSGYLPTVQVSERRWVVPTAALREMLGLGAVSGDE